MHENTNARGHFVYRYVSYGYSIQECTSHLVQTRDAEPEVTYWSCDLYLPMRANLVPIKRWSFVK